MAIDDEQAAYDTTRHLLRLGHRRIGLLTGDPASVHVAQPRKRGYLRAMTEAGCTPVTATGSFFYESGAPGVDKLLQQEPASPQSSPSATRWAPPSSMNCNGAASGCRKTSPSSASTTPPPPCT
ncbi:substrate-binding domain-containing protein [Arthrobacter sp. NPDC056886]|uniref:substrate-binding domain-containing protein n=1 Tax=Arthrobacter sp. NPDC056886 TaxID=3345960 RepID=UPI00366C71C4